MRAGAKSTITPTTTNEYPSASSVETYIGTCRGDQFVRRKVYVSKRRDRPAITSAYPIHLLGGVAILDLDSTLGCCVPQDFWARGTKVTESSCVRRRRYAPPI